MAPNEFNLEVSSNPENLPKIETFVTEIAKQNNLNKDKFNNLTLSIAEAASNCMIHGNKADPKKLVFITVKIEGRKLIIVLRDQGKGFDPKIIPNPTHPENILKDHGRGIHIMKSFMDTVDYNFDSGSTEITLTLNMD